MWQLAREEFAYHRRLLLAVVLVVMPSLAGWMALMARFTELTTGFVKFMPIVCAWALTSHIVEVRRREHRDRQLVLLPFSTRQLAMARMVVAAAPFAAALLTYGASTYLLGLPSHYSFVLRVGLALGFCVCGLQFVIEDLCSTHSRAFQVTATAATMLLVILAMGGYVAATPDQPHPILARLLLRPLDFARSDVGPTWLLSLPVGLSLTSVFTYGRRRSYM